jgi:hypothetical protein
MIVFLESCRVVNIGPTILCDGSTSWVLPAILDGESDDGRPWTVADGAADAGDADRWLSLLIFYM